MRIDFAQRKEKRQEELMEEIECGEYTISTFGGYGRMGGSECKTGGKGARIRHADRIKLAVLRIERDWVIPMKKYGNQAKRKEGRKFPGPNSHNSRRRERNGSGAEIWGGVGDGGGQSTHLERQGPYDDEKLSGQCRDGRGRRCPRGRFRRGSCGGTS